MAENITQAQVDALVQQRINAGQVTGGQALAFVNNRSAEQLGVPLEVWLQIMANIMAEAKKAGYTSYQKYLMNHPVFKSLTKVQQNAVTLQQPGLAKELYGIFAPEPYRSKLAPNATEDEKRKAAADAARSAKSATPVYATAAFPAQQLGVTEGQWATIASNIREMAKRHTSGSVSKYIQNHPLIVDTEMASKTGVQPSNQYVDFSKNRDFYIAHLDLTGIDSVPWTKYMKVEKVDTSVYPIQQLGITAADWKTIQQNISRALTAKGIAPNDAGFNEYIGNHVLIASPAAALEARRPTESSNFVVNRDFYLAHLKPEIVNLEPWRRSDAAPAAQSAYSTLYEGGATPTTSSDAGLIRMSSKPRSQGLFAQSQTVAIPTEIPQIDASIPVSGGSINLSTAPEKAPIDWQKYGLIGGGVAAAGLIGYLLYRRSAN